MVSTAGSIVNGNEGPRPERRPNTFGPVILPENPTRPDRKPAGVLSENSQLVYEVGDLVFGLVSNPDGTLVTIRHRWRAFDPRLHDGLDGSSLFSYLETGAPSNQVLADLLEECGPK